MLVLSRRVDESIVINGVIEVVITAVHGNLVSLGIGAPREVAIWRSEQVPFTAPVGVDRPSEENAAGSSTSVQKG